jgi:hypothetical protein
MVRLPSGGRRRHDAVTEKRRILPLLEIPLYQIALIYRLQLQLREVLLKEQPEKLKSELIVIVKTFLEGKVW